MGAAPRTLYTARITLYTLQIGFVILPFGLCRVFVTIVG